MDKQNNFIIEIAGKELENMKPQLNVLDKEFKKMPSKDKKRWGIKATPSEAVETARKSFDEWLNKESTENPQTAIDIIFAVNPCRVVTDPKEIKHPTERALLIYKQRIFDAINS